MVIRIFYLVVSVFSVAMVYLAIEEPYYSELLNGGEVSANMQMNAVTDYEMNATTISARYEADTWNRYPEFDELVKFRAEIFKGNKKQVKINNNSSDRSQPFQAIQSIIRYSDSKGPDPSYNRFMLCILDYTAKIYRIILNAQFFFEKYFFLS